MSLANEIVTLTIAQLYIHSDVPIKYVNKLFLMLLFVFKKKM